MGILLSPKHPSIALESSVQERVESFLGQHGFNFFHYIRSNLDGSVSTLATYNLVFRQFAVRFPDGPFLYTFFPREMRSLEKYSMLWHEMSDHTPVDIARKLGFFDGVNFVYRYAGFYEVFVFGLSSPIDMLSSFYMSKYNAIEHFILHFKRTNKDIIQVSEQFSVKLKPNNLEAFHSSLCLDQRKISVCAGGIETYLTPKELECVRLMRMGLCNKEVSVHMNISPRSVETYQIRVRERLSLASKEAMRHLNIQIA